MKRKTFISPSQAVILRLILLQEISEARFLSTICVVNWNNLSIEIVYSYAKNTGSRGMLRRDAYI
jgi:hypothetical protein